MKINYVKAKQLKYHPFAKAIGRWRSTIPLHQMMDISANPYSYSDSYFGKSEYNRLIETYPNARVTTHNENKKEIAGIYLEIFFYSIEDETEFLLREST